MLDFLQDVWEQIVALLSKLGLNSWEAVMIIVIILTIDLFLLHRKIQAKKKFLAKQEEGSGDDDERYVEYYKKKQYIYTLRGIMRSVVVLSFVLYYNPNIFAGLAIAVGAFVISFGSVFLSLALYLYLISFYSPGQCVKVGEKTGEIVSITPLYLKILGRNESGEHTGELINIPNNQVWQNNIVLVDLDLGAIQKTIMDILYNYDMFHLGFEDFVGQLKGFLDETFPVNTTKIANHYKSYKGYKYKLDYSLNKDGESVISLGFLCKRSKTAEYKYKIISFLESLQKQAKLQEQGKKNTSNVSSKKSHNIDDTKSPNPIYQTPVGSTNVI